MILSTELLSRFSGGGERPLFLPDLTLWVEWHRGQGTLPERWRDAPLVEIARDLGVPVWDSARPWRVELPGVEVEATEGETERVVRYHTPKGSLVAGWTLGPDGDWWQTEYPVKTAGDLAAAVELARARSYVLDEAEWTRLDAQVGEDGVAAVELPKRPYSDLLHEFLGWSEGLMLLREPAVGEILALLEDALQQLVKQVARLPARVVLSPDNLDGQFISPRAFERYLVESYRRTAELLYERGQRLVVHVGGPIRRLLPLLAACGVDAIEGVAGPPQSDVRLAEARKIAGPELTLWGGIPQDFVLGTHDRGQFEASVVQATREAREDSLAILGVADRVPVDADLSRLEAIPELIRQALAG